MRLFGSCRLPREIMGQEGSTPVVQELTQGPTLEYIRHFKLPRQLLQCLIPTRLQRGLTGNLGGEYGDFALADVLQFPEAVSTSGLDTYFSEKPNRLDYDQATSLVYFNRKLYLMRTQVSTYSGYRLHERPLSFSWQGQRLEVREIRERGYGPDSLFFKVVAADGRVYLLQYQRDTDSWEVEICAPRPTSA